MLHSCCRFDVAIVDKSCACKMSIFFSVSLAPCFAFRSFYVEPVIWRLCECVVFIIFARPEFAPFADLFFKVLRLAILKRSLYIYVFAIYILRHFSLSRFVENQISYFERTYVIFLRLSS